MLEAAKQQISENLKPNASNLMYVFDIASILRPELMLLSLLYKGGAYIYTAATTTADEHGEKEAANEVAGNAIVTAASLILATAANTNFAVKVVAYLFSLPVFGFINENRAAVGKQAFDLFDQTLNIYSFANRK